MDQYRGVAFGAARVARSGIYPFCERGFVFYPFPKNVADFNNWFSIGEQHLSGIRAAIVVVEDPIDVWLCCEFVPNV